MMRREKTNPKKKTTKKHKKKGKTEMTAEHAFTPTICCNGCSVTLHRISNQLNKSEGKG